MIKNDLHNVDIRAKAQVRMITALFAKNRGINEALKNADPIEWTAQMNTAKHDAEEIVLCEVVYQWKSQ